MSLIRTLFKIPARHAASERSLGADVETPRASTETGPAPLLLEPVWRDRLYSSGWREAASNERIDVIEPATGKLLTRVAAANADDVTRAAHVAKAAQPAWAARHPEERARILHELARLLIDKKSEMAPWLMRESGSIATKADVEFEHSAGFVRHAAAMATEPQGLMLPSEAGRLSMAKRVPLGVVGVISPFNFPLVLSMRAVAPALAAGNAVVLKPDPRTPISGGFLIARLFEEAGLPPDLLHALPGHVEAGEAMCRDPNIAMISLTGSTRAGRRVAELAGGLLKKVQLELGGKNTMIVLDDADVDLAASNAAWGAWLHQGQVCLATGRILAHKSIAGALATKLAEKAQRLPVGDPMSGQVALGPMISRAQVERLHAIVHDSVKAGARLLAGGAHDALFYKPTVLAGVRPGMRAFEEEFFGPVAAVTEFATDDEAIALADRNEYGLVASIITGSVDRGQILGDHLEVGHLHINDQTVLAEPFAPFGGRRASGNGGRISGPANWDEFTTWKWITARSTPPAYPF